MYSFKNLKTPTNTLPGLAELALIALVDWFEEGGIKQPGAYVTPGDEITIFADHVFKPGLGFITCRLAPDKNNYDAKMIGDTGFNKFANEVKLMLPGSYVTLHEEIFNYLNKPCIILVRDANCQLSTANWYQIGTENVPARIAPTFTTGTTKDGEKAYQLSITNTAEKVYLYQGDITYYGDDDTPVPGPITARVTYEISIYGIGIFSIYIDGSESTGPGILNYTFTLFYQTNRGPAFEEIPLGITNNYTFDNYYLADWTSGPLIVSLSVTNGTYTDVTLITDAVGEQPVIITRPT